MQGWSIVMQEEVLWCSMLYFQHWECFVDDVIAVSGTPMLNVLHIPHPLECWILIAYL